MATIIEQHPLYNVLTVGQDVIFTVSNTSIVSNYTNAKFIAEVYISSGNPPNPSSTTDIVGTFKTTPNNAGVGMFDFRPIIESFVNADNLARRGSSYKGTVIPSNLNVPIHLIDKYSRNLNTMRYLFVRFKIEFINSQDELITGFISDSKSYKVFNGYLKHTDVLDLIGVNFGYDPLRFQLRNGLVGGRFLTNAASTQYANINDYGTLSFLSTPESVLTSDTTLSYFKISMYDDSGVPIGVPIQIDNLSTNGGVTVWNAQIYKQLMFIGCFPANLRNWNTSFQSAIPTLSYYFVQAYNSSNQAISDEITININCPTTKGYEPIRLCWLNQWGVWDYYTFTQKSTKMISTKGSTYQQLEGSWNKSSYKIDSFKGGKKAFRVNATEKITMNTDFVSEAESEWFEDLINSPEVYILKGFQKDTTEPALNQYVIPVRLTTSSFTKKTVANDRLMQYTFEVEKSKTLRTQSI